MMTERGTSFEREPSFRSASRWSVVACSASVADIAQAPAGGSETIVVGVSGAFAENQIVAEMYAQVLERPATSSSDSWICGPVRYPRTPWSRAGSISNPSTSRRCSSRWTGTREASGDPTPTLPRQLRDLLRSRGITLLTPSPAEDTNQFVANAKTAERFDLTTMSSLAHVAG